MGDGPFVPCGGSGLDVAAHDTPLRPMRRIDPLSTRGDEMGDKGPGSKSKDKKKKGAKAGGTKK